MRTSIRSIPRKLLLTGVIGIALSLIGIGLDWNLQTPNSFLSVDFRLVSGLELMGLGLLAALALGLVRQQRLIRMELADNEQKMISMERELKGVQWINRILTTAQDEKQLVEGALNMILDISGATAVSLVPMDEWGIPLPAYSLGKLPQPMLTSWAEHLTALRVRKICHQCQRLHAEAGEKCPLLEGPYSAVDVYCLPMQRNELMLGMLNLYLLPSQKLDASLRAFLEQILVEIGQGVETLRQRSRELNTLRYYQQDERESPDLGSQFGGLIEDLLPLLEAEAAILRVQSPDLSGGLLRLTFGTSSGLAVLENSARQSAQVVGVTEAVEAKGPGRLQVNSLMLPDGSSVGELWIWLRDGAESGECQSSLIEVIAHQVGLLLEMERFRKSIKFETVVQERIRLAREIHDNLAQTLAFLKLTTAQMQNYLGQGDYPRLNQAIKQSYQALSEAYIDTRKSIEDLRLAPREGLFNWLSRLSKDYERDFSIPIQMDVTQEMPALNPEIEIQIMRIIQEALNNVRKHADARHVDIRAHSQKEDLIIEIQDDGCGFSPAEVPEISRFGLRGMRERAEAVGADFQVLSQPGQGTTVRLQLPIPLQEVIS
ncbi:histidine kinase [Longilinea arvoryzae]|uniref:histidine kinase n=1 Tax=Longilinea arvoryzae TaxID=360412 RepID=A0A0S7BN05_9CHLR|nr:sensor histidine kinase [Longilinea arvoryzae]GAP15189.1 histidine kinase [Longilinea arvoryzae]